MKKEIIVITFLLTSNVAYSFDTANIPSYIDQAGEAAKTVSKKIGTAVGTAINGAVSGSNAGEYQSSTQTNSSNLQQSGGFGNIQAQNYSNKNSMVTVQTTNVGGTATMTQRNGTANIQGQNIHSGDTGLLYQDFKSKNLKMKQTNGRVNVQCVNCSLKK